MQKLKMTTIELLFILIAASILFIITFQQMSTSGILPGNDPAVHLIKAEKIVIDERVTYSAVPWYPPLFHTILAVLQIFAGTLDIMTAAFLLKMLMATLNVLIMLSTYLLARKILGIGIAVTSAVFTILSVPLFEMIFWGGYANFLGLAYITYIFYIMNKDLQVSVKTFLLFFGAITIVLSHQLATFVFVLMFIPIFLINSISGSKRKILAFLGVIVGGGLALLAWYARLLIEYSNMIIEHLFFAMKENVYNIPEVGLDALIRNNFGASFFLAIAGIPMTFILLKKKKAIQPALIIILWLAIPLVLSQSHLFGLYLPYIRFVYFFAIPITILAATFTYSFTKLPAVIKQKITSKIRGKKMIWNFSTVVAITVIIALFILQGVFFLQRTESYPQFYERATISSYESGLWIKQHAVSDGTIVTARSPGTWYNLFSNHQIIEETNPLYVRNAVAESVLYSFYEIENSRTLTREYVPSSSSAGQAVYVPVYNIWRRAINIPNNHINLIYVDPFGKWVIIPLSETEENIYWSQRSANETQLVSEYVHQLFTIKKVVTISSESSAIDIKWNIKVNQHLALVKLDITNYFDSSIVFKDALVPGFLAWQNPWDNPNLRNPSNEWAILNGPADMLEEQIIALFDEQEGVLAAFEFDDPPDWFILGALDNRIIDALRLRYEFGDLEKDENRQISLSILTNVPESGKIKTKSITELKQILDTNASLLVQGRDFHTYIEQYEIKFVVIDTQSVLSNLEPSPALDKIYDNGRINIYTTKR